MACLRLDRVSISLVVLATAFMASCGAILGLDDFTEETASGEGGSASSSSTQGQTTDTTSSNGSGGGSGGSPDHCTNGHRDEDETSSDCGGSCMPCDDNGGCEFGSDCKSKVCVTGTCRAATCTDGLQNGDEAGEDCGGTTCAGCELGTACNVDRDCRSGICTVSKCAPFATQISVGASSTCALTSRGGVKCWGMNDHNQIGDGTMSSRPLPTTPTGVDSGVSFLDASGWSGYAVRASGASLVWGDTFGGTPGTIPQLDDTVATIGHGYFEHTCFVTIAGAAKCWGKNTNGELGNDSTTDSTTPVAVSGLASGVSSVATGEGFSCALMTAGGIKCWGYAPALGINATGDAHVPVDVTLPAKATHVTTGQGHACARLTNEQVYCWGQNNFGQLGNNSTAAAMTPQQVVFSGAATVAGGLDDTCAVMLDKSVRCWGFNAVGMLGDGTATDRLVPTLVSGIPPVAEVRSGYSHTCALLESGDVSCWGNNSGGALGDGTTSNSLVPVFVVER